MSTRLLIISGCTRDKAVHHANDLRVPDFADPARFQKAEAALAQLRTPATSMYLGQEHMRLTATLAVLRERLGANAVEHRIMSAGYGLLTEHQLVVPYDATFDTMTEPEADDWAEFLGIPASVREAVRGAPVVAFVLYPPYRRAIRLPLEPASGQRYLWLSPDDDALPEITAAI